MGSINFSFKSSGANLTGMFFPAQTAEEPITFLFIPGWPALLEDFLDLGPNLSKLGIHFMSFYPRGFHSSEGESSFSHTLEDIGSALRYLQQVDLQKQFHIDPSNIILGGYSFGGGMALAYAAQDPTIKQIISIAGTDHGEFVREMHRNATFASGIREFLLSTKAPAGPVRFNLEEGFQELYDHQEIFGLRENASTLAERSILLIGGWDDMNVTIEDSLLPFYRSLKKSGGKDVTFIVYHTDHSFKFVLSELASDIATWIHTK